VTIEAAPAAEARRALAVGIACYLMWGATPALFIVMGKAGATPLEILAQRAMWSAPWAILLVILTGQLKALRHVFGKPRLLAALALSAALIGSGWAVFVWAVTHGHNLEASLGYYITPLLNMAVGVAVFRERVDIFGVVAMVLAAAGVALQTLALGHLPIISLFLAATFWGYGLIRKHVDADALTGLFVECLLMAGPGLAYVIWLNQSGQGLFGRSATDSLLMSTAGPATVAPLALFSWTARRLPFSVIGFLQFISPTIGFLIGLAVGERLNPIGMGAVAFIWAGAATFAFGAWRAMRLLRERLPHPIQRQA
jgi:chloramphenicol-sensitive protein RarD